MTPLTTRERKKNQTRDELIEAALGLFRERGYDATTVDDIVTAANYSRATFFRHFPTKEDVVFIDLPARITELEHLDDLPHGVDLWESAKQAVVEQVLGFTSLQPGLEADCVRLWFTEPALIGKYGEITIRCDRAIAAFFANRLGLDPDANIPCQILASAIIGVGRAVTHAGLVGEDAIRAALEDGFALIERDIKRTLHELQGVRPGGHR